MRTLLIILLLSSFLAPAAALEISAVSPSTATPGTVISLSGGPFTTGDRVLVGEVSLSTRVLTPSRLLFTLPTLPSGEYALAIDRDGTRTPPAFILQVIQPPPTITGITPATLDSCTDSGERQITVSGTHIRPGALILLDETSLPVEKGGRDEIVLTLPQLKPGLHKIQVVNPDNQHSLSHGLFISSTPEITSVQSGEENVVNYELIIKGKNFLFDSKLSANGTVVGKGVLNISPDGSERESMHYVDCNTIIYRRRPFIREARELSLQVVNPGGEQSNPYRLTAP